MQRIVEKLKEELEISKKVKIKIRQNRPKFQISEKENKFYIEIKSRPEKNKANNEIANELSKLIGKKITIISGLKSRDKIISCSC